MIHYYLIENAYRTLLLSPFLLWLHYRARYVLVFHLRTMWITSSMTTPYARHALRHARMTVERVNSGFSEAQRK